MSVGKRVWTDKKGVKRECWYYCITIQKTPRIQKRKNGFAKKGLAVAAEQEALEALRKGENIDLHKLTFADCADMFMDKQLAKNTRNKYKIAYKLHILPFLGQKLMCEINSQTPDIWVKTLIKKGVGVAMINDCLKICKAQCNYLVRKKIIYNNPFEFTEKLKDTKPRMGIKCFTTRQAVRMMRRARKKYPKFYMILYLAFYTGMRQGELLGLDIKNIDFKNLRIEVTQQYTGKELKEVLKTTSSYGYVEIEPAVADEIKKYITQNNIKSGLLFTNEQGKPIDKNNMVRRWFKPLLEELKFDTSMRFHDLRHTYASIMLSAGVSYLYVCKQMRHSKPSVTLDIYAHFIPDANRQDVKIIGEKFSDQIVNIEEYRALKKRAQTLL